jgi:hypothetical protein
LESNFLSFTKLKKEKVMAEFQRTKLVKAGGWRTLEDGWSTSFTCRFVSSAGAQIKIRYGGGWIFGWDSQKQTLDGVNAKSVHVEAGSLLYARVQMEVKSDVKVTYAYITTGPRIPQEISQ